MKHLRKALPTLLAATMLAACGNDAPSDNSHAAKQAAPATAPIRPETLAPYASRPNTEEIMYFVMPDRFYNGDPSNDHGAIEGGPADHGFDPSNKGFYHGGDLKGLTAKLDYLADMGISAIWFTPIFKNKAVQGNPESLSSGYHGYWITDFTQVDPHIGTNDDLKELVAEAHKRNMKVIFDIITNHTADVIKYQECYPEGSTDTNVPLCAYRSREDYPYTSRGGKGGTAINDGFLGDEPENQTEENFARLTDLDYAYTPYVPESEHDVKVPAWLNDMRYYHNRGDSEWKGESSLYGDFSGLDDLFTEHPAVKAGMIDIYKQWISEFKIDGFRIDTVRHVNDSFWQAFAPAILEHAKAEGIPNFYMFGEVFNPSPEYLSHFTTVAKLPAVLDFGFQSGTYHVFAEDKGPRVIADVFAQDELYKSPWSSADILPTFLGNHDMGRIGHFITSRNPDMSPAVAFQKDLVAHALMYYGRGVPVIYYGDEQGFIGDGGDQDAREDMFASSVASYADNDLLGTDKSSADDNFDTAHPMYRTLARFAAVKRAHPALRGGKQEILFADENPGILAFTRTDATSADKLTVVINTSVEKAEAPLALDAGSCLVDGMAGTFGASYTAPALSWAVYKDGACE